jgi:O-antigen biosynthesis protein
MAARLFDLDVADVPHPPTVPTRYTAVRALVRLQGRPLGVVQVPNAADALDSTAFFRSVVAELGSALRAELERARWTTAESPAPVDLPSITVVVCTRDRPEELEECLAALAAQSRPAQEIVVVDNAPSDGRTRLVAERWPVRYVVEPRPGLDWARNRGWAEARSEVVAYTDDDARPDPGWLDAIAQGFESEQVQAITGQVLAAELETRSQLLFENVYGGMGKGFTFALHCRRGRPMTFAPNLYGCGCNMAFRRELVDRLGGFDPALDVGTATAGGGDIDMFQRVLETDAVIAYRPDALVRHVHRRTQKQLRRQLFDNGRAFSAVMWAALLRAHGVDRLRVVHAYGTWMYGWCVRRVVRSLLRRESMPMHMILIELAGGILGPALYPLARRRARSLAGRPAA